MQVYILMRYYAVYGGMHPEEYDVGISSCYKYFPVLAYIFINNIV